ncbi:uncharacterized protein PFLUO_LOCUS8209 [Penicillium psychrofluorescens]|uniref:uncharacterized protein n=1 Tax=Penicillium psychrofluorescens TaxID=3158075 RepID=UPI003CCC9A08
MPPTCHKAPEAPEAPSEPAPSDPAANAETPVNAPGPIVVDNFGDDTNSEFSDELSDLTSLSSSVLEYEYENGRRYCSAHSVSSVAQPMPLVLSLNDQLTYD